MKYAANILGALLGLPFIAFGAMFFLNMMPKADLPPAGTPAALFMGAFMPTGYMHLVMACELIGGLLTAIPKTRNWGLLVLGPVLINILAFHIFITKWADIGMPAALAALALILLIMARRKFAGLLN